LACIGALVGCGAEDGGEGADVDAEATVRFDVGAGSGGSDGAQDASAADAARALPDTTPADAGPADAAEHDARPADAAPEADASDRLDDAAPPDATVDAISPDAEPVPEDAALQPPDAAAIPCDPPLAIEPAEAAALPLDLRTLHAEGGTGEWRFELVSNESGALVNPLSGAYLAGDVEDVVDVVRLTDLGCDGFADAEIRVVPPMVVRPSQAEVRPGARFSFEVEQGSGEAVFRLVESGSEGGIDGMGRYIAGHRAGRDFVEVEDTGTGETREVVITVAIDAALHAEPRQLHVVVGGTVPLRVEGGSGVLTTEVGEGVVALEDTPEGPVIRGVSPGRVALRVTDRFTGMQTEVDARVMINHQQEQPWMGHHSHRSAVAAPGDMDGDGDVEAIVGVHESALSGYFAGAVFVYLGQAIDPEGEPIEPAQVLTGFSRREEFGRSLATGDFDSDGIVDLAVGARGADVGGPDRGAVYLFRGRPPGDIAAGATPFEDVPYRVLGGVRNSDFFGWGVAACDFDADGRVDLAVGAPFAEDIEAEPRRNTQGGVFVHLQYEDGFLDRADSIGWGRLPVGPDGAMEGGLDMHLGVSVAAADVDGDGHCDVVAGGEHVNPLTGRNGDGVLQVFRGRAAGDDGAGGVHLEPSRIIAGLTVREQVGSFALFVAAGDVTGDGRAEILASQYRYEADDQGDDNEGAVRMYLGGPLPEVAERVEAVGVSDWDWIGDNPQDQAGWHVAVGDVDGDGVGDVVACNYRGEVEGQPNDTGAVAVWTGEVGGIPSQTPARKWAGEDSEDRLGNSLAVLGDFDGDGETDLVAFANLADGIARDVGQPYILSWEPDQPPPEPEAEPPHPGVKARLTFPGETSGAQFGWDVAIVGDVNGDGFEDLAVGAHLADDEVEGVNSGGAWVYPGGEGGFPAEAGVRLVGFPGHNSFDQFGAGVARAGDFDGDGIDDLAVSADADERDPTAAAEFAPGWDCVDRMGSQGSVFIFSGTRGALPEAPTFVWYGDRNNTNPRFMAGGFDANGDGFDDMLVGTRLYDVPVNDAGAVWLLFGRARNPEGITTLCDAIRLDTGEGTSDWLGRSMTGIGDLDGDGCDEIAYGAPREIVDEIRQGVVRVVFGWGGRGCPGAPTYTALRSAARDSEFGWSVGGGGDLNGDGVPDLVVGSPLHRPLNDAVGAAWWISGAAIERLPREGLSYDGANRTRLTALADLGEDVAIVSGHVASGRFGSDVALVPGAGAGGRALLAVGSPFGDASGAAQSGGAWLYEWAGGTLGARPVGVVGGEGDREGGRMGEVLDASRDPRRPALVIGGYEASGTALDGGGAYSADLRR
jgi:hypothetical protein